MLAEKNELRESVKRKLRSGPKHRGLKPMGKEPPAGAAVPPSVKRHKAEEEAGSRKRKVAARRLEYEAEHRDELLRRAAWLADRGEFSEADMVLINMFIAGELGCFQYSGHNTDYKEQFQDMWDAAQDPVKLDGATLWSATSAKG